MKESGEGLAPGSGCIVVQLGVHDAPDLKPLSLRLILHHCELQRRVGPTGAERGAPARHASERSERSERSLGLSSMTSSGLGVGGAVLHAEPPLIKVVGVASMLMAAWERWCMDAETLALVRILKHISEAQLASGTAALEAPGSCPKDFRVNCVQAPLTLLVPCARAIDGAEELNLKMEMEDLIIHLSQSDAVLLSLLAQSLDSGPATAAGAGAGGDGTGSAGLWSDEGAEGARSRSSWEVKLKGISLRLLEGSEQKVSSLRVLARLDIGAQVLEMVSGEKVELLKYSLQQLVAYSYFLQVGVQEMLRIEEVLQAVQLRVSLERSSKSVSVGLLEFRFTACFTRFLASALRKQDWFELRLGGAAKASYVGNTTDACGDWPLGPPVKIGMALSLTSGGPDDAMAQVIVSTLEQLLRWVNRVRGGLCMGETRRAVELLVLDTQGKVDTRKISWWMERAWDLVVGALRARVLVGARACGPLRARNSMRSGRAAPEALASQLSAMDFQTIAGPLSFDAWTMFCLTAVTGEPALPGAGWEDGRQMKDELWTKSIDDVRIETQCFLSRWMWSAPLRCEPCPQGTTSLVDHCVPCAPGRFAAAKGSACVACAAGSVAPHAGATECAPCRAGHRGSWDGRRCEECPVGSYQPNSNSSECLPAVEGADFNATGLISGRNLPGYWARRRGAVMTWERCEAGRSGRSALGSSACRANESCAAANGGAQCFSCVPGAVKVADGGCSACGLVYMKIFLLYLVVIDALFTTAVEVLHSEPFVLEATLQLLPSWSAPLARAARCAVLGVQLPAASPSGFPGALGGVAVSRQLVQSAQSEQLHAGGPGGSEAALAAALAETRHSEWFRNENHRRFGGEVGRPSEEFFCLLLWFLLPWILWMLLYLCSVIYVQVSLMRDWSFYRRASRFYEELVKDRGDACVAGTAARALCAGIARAGGALSLRAPGRRAAVALLLRPGGAVLELRGALHVFELRCGIALGCRGAGGAELCAAPNQCITADALDERVSQGLPDDFEFPPEYAVLSLGYRLGCWNWEMYIFLVKALLIGSSVLSPAGRSSFLFFLSILHGAVVRAVSPFTGRSDFVLLRWDRRFALFFVLSSMLVQALPCASSVEWVFYEWELWQRASSRCGPRLTRRLVQSLLNHYRRRVRNRAYVSFDIKLGWLTVHYRRAEAFEAAGEVSKAIAACKLSLEVHPENVDVRKKLSSLKAQEADQRKREKALFSGLRGLCGSHSDPNAAPQQMMLDRGLTDREAAARLVDRLGLRIHLDTSDSSNFSSQFTSEELRHWNGKFR
eukprot:g20954.t1